MGAIRALSHPKASRAERPAAPTSYQADRLRNQVSLWSGDLKAGAANAARERAKLQRDGRRLESLLRSLPWDVRRRRVGLTTARKRFDELQDARAGYDELFDYFDAAAFQADARTQTYEETYTQAQEGDVPTDLVRALRECVDRSREMHEHLAAATRLTIENAQLASRLLEDLQAAVEAASQAAVLRRSDARMTLRVVTGVAEDLSRLSAWVSAAWYEGIPEDSAYSPWRTEGGGVPFAPLALVLGLAVALVAAGRRIRTRVLGDILVRDREPLAASEQKRLWRRQRLLDVLRFVLTFLFTYTALALLPITFRWFEALTALAAALCGYRALRALLRLLLSPGEPHFREFRCDDGAAHRVFSAAQWLLACSAICLPVLYALAAFDYPRAGVVYAIKLIFGAGLVAMVLWLLNSGEGPLGVVAVPGSELDIRLRRLGRVVTPFLSILAVALLVISAIGYANLSAYLARGVLLTAVFAAILWPVQVRAARALEKRFPTELLELIPGEPPMANPLHAGLRLAERIAVVAVGAILLAIAWQVRGYHISDLAAYCSLPLFTIKEAKVSIAGIGKGILVGWAAHAIARMVRTRTELSSHLAQKWDHGARYAVGAALYYCIFSVGVVIAILVAGMQLGVLTAFAGMLGVAVGFGSQDIAKNTICGLIILLDPSINVGDYVDVAGQSGTITEISIRSTTIRTHDNRRVVIPNSTFYSQNVVLSSHRDRRVRVAVEIAIAPDADLEQVTALLADTAAAHRDILRDPPPDVVFTKLSAAALNLQLIVWTDQITRVPEVQGALMTQLWRACQEHEIKFV